MTLILTIQLFTAALLIYLGYAVLHQLGKLKREIRFMSVELNDALAGVSSQLDNVAALVVAEAAQAEEALSHLNQPDPDVAAAVATLNGMRDRLASIGDSVKAIIPDAVEPPAEPASVEPPAEG